MKQLQHAGRVASSPFTLANHLTHQCHTVFRRALLVQQDFFYQSVGSGRVMLFVIVSQHRHLRITVVGVVL